MSKVSRRITSFAIGTGLILSGCGSATGDIQCPRGQSFHTLEKGQTVMDLVRENNPNGDPIGHFFQALGSKKQTKEPHSIFNNPVGLNGVLIDIPFEDHDIEGACIPDSNEAELGLVSTNIEP
jgi:hypothetical protein